MFDGRIACAAAPKSLWSRLSHFLCELFCLAAAPDFSSVVAQGLAGKGSGTDGGCDGDIFEALSSGKGSAGNTRSNSSFTKIRQDFHYFLYFTSSDATASMLSRTVTEHRDTFQPTPVQSAISDRADGSKKARFALTTENHAMFRIDCSSALPCPMVLSHARTDPVIGRPR